MTSVETEIQSLQRSHGGKSSSGNSKTRSTTVVNQHDDNTIADDTGNCTTVIRLIINEFSILSRLAKGVCLFIVFTGIIMMIGILTVYYTTPKPPSKICTFILKSEARSSISDDSHPHSIAVGDFNNDGFPDIVVPNSGTNNIGIFLRRNNKAFLEQKTYSTGIASKPYAVAIGDFNQDQRTDIVVANFGSHNIGVFLAIGNGTFIAHKNFSTGSSRPRWIVVGDINNDTKLDLIVANYGTNTIGILLGDGNGNFANPKSFFSGFDSIPYSLSVADLNKDNVLDVVVANYGTNSVGVFFGLGNVTFAAQIILNTGIDSRPYSIAIADLNDDTYVDIVVTCSGSNNVNVFLNSGNGTFLMPKSYSTGNNSLSHSVAIDDFDNDGKLDIVIANYGTVSINILIGNGNGSFANSVTYFTSAGSNPYSLTIGNFNNDTRIDIAVANYDFNYVDIILTNRNYSFLNQITYRTTGLASKTSSIALADLNNDNRVDIVVANPRLGNIGVFLNNDNDNFFSQVTYSTGSGSSPNSVAVGDFNNDTWLDIVVANRGMDNVRVFLGVGDGTFTSQIKYTTGTDSGPTTVTIGDVNNDGRLDIIVVNFDTNNLGVLIGYGNGTFTDQTIYSTGDDSQPYYVAVGDLNNDTLLDIVVTNYGTGNIGVFLGIGDGKFSNQNTFSTGTDSKPIFITVIDLNNDNCLDMVVVNNGINSIGIFLGKGDGKFFSQTTYVTGSNSSPQLVGIADFNSDKELDIVVTNYQNANFGVFFGYGNGSFSAQVMHPTGEGSKPYPIAVGDLNDDHRPDIVVGNNGPSNIGILFGYGNGSFSTQNTYLIQGDSNPQFIAVGDLNNDSRLDVVVANYWGDNIDIFLGIGDGTLSKQISYSTDTNSSPYSVAMGDLNNDHRLDIVVANSGTNTIGIFIGYGNGTFASQKTYSTDEYSEPYAVVVGDFNNDTYLDIVVANYGTNNIGVFLGNGDGTFSNQTIFSTGSDSGPQALVAFDFNHDNRLDIAFINLWSECLGIFLGFGDGSFADQICYFTPPGTGIFNLAIGDLNEDGQQDIVVTIYYSRSINIYLGNENGTFVSGATYSTGGTSRPKSVAVGDFNNDNRLDIIVANCKSDNIIIFIGNGDGTFGDIRIYSTGSDSCPNSIAVGDFNSDNILDVVVANYDSNTIGIFLGYTYISGVRENTYSTGSAPHPRALALGDFNHDTELDIAIAIYGLNNVGVLLGYTDGTFSSQAMFSTGALSFPTSVAIADLNNDSQLDIIVTNSATDNVGILLGYSNGSFGSAELYSLEVGSQSQSVAVGDFNNDKKLDIVVANSGTNNVLALLKYDTGAFQKQISYPTRTGSNPQWVSTGDFNMDNWLDFVVVNSGNDSIGVFLALSSGSFANETIYSTGIRSNPWSSLVVDFNNDKCLDIVVANTYGDNVGVFLGFCNGTFANQTIYLTGNYSGPSAVAVVDLNNDSQLDIVVTLHFSYQIGIFYCYANGSFSNIIIYSTGDSSSPVFVDVADFNNDHRLDIVVANYQSDSIGIFFGYDNHTFLDIVIHSAGFNSRPQSLVLADFNKDGRTDIAVANSGADNVVVFFGNNNGTFFNQITLSTGSRSSPHGIAIGDFNNDKQVDIAVVNYGTNTLGILLACVNGTFFSQLTYSTDDGSQPFFLAVGDFNSDSRLDVIVANSGADNVDMFLGYVNENFLVGPPYSTGLFSQPTSIGVADFDTDTKLDVVVANEGTDNIMILFGSGFGTFVNQMMYSTGNGSQPCSVAIGDLNRDSRIDIVVANAGTNTIGVFLGNGIGTFSNQMTYFTGAGSQPNSVTILDFNNDTRLDIAVANYGANNVGVFFGYGNGSFDSQLIFGAGFGSRPFALATGDVNMDNLTDIVASNNGYGNINILMKTC